MARTAPVPNIPPIPGMCPSVAVLAGGGDGGGGRGKGAGAGAGGAGAGTGSDGAAAEGDERGAPDYQRYPECGHRSHPVDVITGRAFTHPIRDFALPGPMPLVFERMYSSKAAGIDMGLGFGWAHRFGWRVEVGRRSIRVWNDQGVQVEFEKIGEGRETLGPWGWVLRREPWGFAVDADDGLWHIFSHASKERNRYLLTAVEDRNRNRLCLAYKDDRLVEVVDSAGRRIRIQSTSEGRVESFAVLESESRDLWLTVVLHASDALGRQVGRQLPAGGSIESAFDALDRLVRRAARCPAEQRTVGPGEPEWVGARRLGHTVDRAYRYALGSEVVGAWDLLPGHEVEYRYDPVGQLSAVLASAGRTEMFSYDAADNLYEAGPGAEERAYGPGGRLLRRGDVEYRWDEHGRLVEKTVRGARGTPDAVFRYQWDAAGLVRSIQSPDGSLVEFFYDAFARRVEKRVSRPSGSSGTPALASSTRFIWDGDLLVHEVRQVHGERGEVTVLERTYCFEDDSFEPLAQRDGLKEPGAEPRVEWFHYLNDPAGKPDRLIDASGRVAFELRTTARGDDDGSPPGRTGTPLRLQGQYRDGETSLCYVRFRYFDPAAGCFISPDPLVLLGGLNPFAFPGSPTLFIDPLGLAPRTGRPFRRPVSFASPSSVAIDMNEVVTGHTRTGHRSVQSAQSGRGKDVFPDDWSHEEIERAVRDAYRNADTEVRACRQDGDSKVVLQGTSRGVRIEMWYNRTTRTIETAYPAGNPVYASGG